MAQALTCLPDEHKLSPSHHRMHINSNIVRGQALTSSTESPMAGTALVAGTTKLCFGPCLLGLDLAKTNQL